MSAIQIQARRWSPLDIKFFLSFWAGDGILGILMIIVLPPTFIPSCFLEVKIGESPHS